MPLSRMKKDESAAPERASTVERAFALIEMVVTENRSMSLAEMALRLGLPKATVHRIAIRLEEQGLLVREPVDKQFTIGPRLNALAIDTVAASVRRAPRHAILETLARETGETCNLGMLDSNAVLYLDRVETHWPLRLQLSVGSHVPLHCTAMGKLFLSQMPKRARERLYIVQPLQRFTENTVTDPATLEGDLAEIRRTGVSLNNQEYMVGLVGMAVPIPDPVHKSRFPAAVAIHAPQPRLDVVEMRQHLPALRRAAERMSVELFDVG